MSWSMCNREPINRDCRLIEKLNTMANLCDDISSVIHMRTTISDIDLYDVFGITCTSAKPTTLDRRRLY